MCGPPFFSVLKRLFNVHVRHMHMRSRGKLEEGVRLLELEFHVHELCDMSWVEAGSSAGVEITLNISSPQQDLF